MMNLFERFDQIEARFAKLFAAFVLLLVVGLILADVLTVVWAQLSADPNPAGPAVDGTRCAVMPDGTRVCDFPPPGRSKSI